MSLSGVPLSSSRPGSKSDVPSPAKKRKASSPVIRGSPRSAAKLKSSLALFNRTPTRPSETSSHRCR